MTRRFGLLTFSKNNCTRCSRVHKSRFSSRTKRRIICNARRGKHDLWKCENCNKPYAPMAKSNRNKGFYFYFHMINLQFKLFTTIMWDSHRFCIFLALNLGSIMFFVSSKMLICFSQRNYPIIIIFFFFIRFFACLLLLYFLYNLTKI